MNDALASQLVGDWLGTMRLFLSWLPEPEFPSVSRLTIARRAQGRFLELSYDWSYEGAQEGVLLLGHDEAANVTTAAWVDTWHQGTRVMGCRGSRDAEGVLTLLGAYEVQNSPDWHWRIALMPLSQHDLLLEMYNVSPEGKDDLAVRADYRRMA